MRVLVTGASGFVGQALVPWLEQRGFEVVRAVRPDAVTNGVVIPDFYRAEAWVEALAGVDAVVHLIAQTQGNDGSLYHRVNVDMTTALCAAIEKSSVQKLVYLSSVKVHGETTAPGAPFSEQSPTAPQDAYGATKLAAEQVITDSFSTSGKSYVIIRPPLVYGPKLTGNLDTLRKIIGKAVPLPFGALKNARSLVALPSLVRFIEQCLGPAIDNETFLVSEDRRYSTADLVRKIARDHGLTARLFPCPPLVLKALFAVTGRKNLQQKLMENLEVDNRRAKDLTDCRPDE